MLLIPVLATLLSACGGGSDAPSSPGSSPTSNVVPVANAGRTQNVTTGTTVTLDGSASSDANGDSLTYAWSLTSIPSGSAATLSGSDSAAPSFVADVAGVYVATLVVSDGKALSQASTVTITATIANAAPVAQAGSTQNVTAGSLVTLDGSGSSDANGDTLTYAWTLTTSPTGSTASLRGADTAAPSFIADLAGTYIASLVVNDGQASSAPASVTITATTANAAPVANAGLSQSVVAGSVVTLNGSGSTDANGDTLTYAWTLTSRPAASAAVLSGANTASPTFTADVAGIYVASLVVNDGRTDSATASVTITVAAANAIPVAHAGPAQNVSTGSTVTLDGSRSSDANGDRLTYAWSLTARPAGSTAVLAGADSAAPTFVADVAGVYVATLTVNDGRASSAASTVTITATVANAAPVANAGPAQSVVAGTTVSLDGRRSSDANGDTLTFSWTLTARPVGSSAVLSAANTATPTFLADAPGVYVASLVVSDGRASSSVATVTITASVANAAPVAQAGPAQTVVTGTTVRLDGSRSSDANGDPLTYAWTLTARPEGSSAALSGASSVNPSFTADVPGVYVATLVVNDGRVTSAASTVTVTVTAPSLALIQLPSGSCFFSCTETPLSLPYASTGAASLNCIGNGCPALFDLGSFRLEARGAAYTITNVSATNLTAGSTVTPTIEGLANGAVIPAGQTLTFSLKTPSTRGARVTLRFSFMVAETGQTFVYTQQVSTN
jgi:hypothetical protein